MPLCRLEGLGHGRHTLPRVASQQDLGPSMRACPSVLDFAMLSSSDLASASSTNLARVGLHPITPPMIYLQAQAIGDFMQCYFGIFLLGGSC